MIQDDSRFFYERDYKVGPVTSYKLGYGAPVNGRK